MIVGTGASAETRILSAEELKAGVEIAGVHGSMVSVKTAKGVSFLPKAHVKPAGAAETAAA